MVDAHAFDRLALRQARDQAVRGREHLRVFGAHRREVGDLEETAIVDLVGGDAPVREPVMLLLEDPMDRKRISGTRRLAPQRKGVIEISDALVSYFYFTRFQRLAVVAAEHRQEDLAAPPVDVEEL